MPRKQIIKTPTSKNKVVPTKPASTPPPPPSPSVSVSDADLVTVASFSSEVSTASSRRHALPAHIQRKLAADIEQAGGIQLLNHRHKLSSILNLDTLGTYGSQGDPIRLRIRKKVWYWKKQHIKGTYISDVLKKLQVEPAVYTLGMSEDDDEDVQNKFRKQVSLHHTDQSLSHSLSDDSSVESVPHSIQFSIPESTVDDTAATTTMKVSTPFVTQSSEIPKGTGTLSLTVYFQDKPNKSSDFLIFVFPQLRFWLIQTSQSLAAKSLSFRSEKFSALTARATTMASKS